MFERIDRITFEKNPLVGVIGTFQFQPILRIGTEIPAAFQERVRESYPLYHKRTPQNIESAPLEIASSNTIEFGLPSDTTVVHLFSSEDGHRTISLSADQLSLTTDDYHTWEDFRSHLGFMVQAFATTYGIAHFMYASLQYLDLIDRDELGLASLPWRRLLQPTVIGLYGSPSLNDEELLGMHMEAGIRISDSITQQIETGLATIDSHQNDCFVIYSQTILEDSLSARGDWMDGMNRIHDYANRFFMNAITPELKSSLGPLPIGSQHV